MYTREEILKMKNHKGENIITVALILKEFGI
jgi:hypothetical protein